MVLVDATREDLFIRIPAWQKAVEAGVRQLRALAPLNAWGLMAWSPKRIPNPTGDTLTTRSTSIGRFSQLRVSSRRPLRKVPPSITVSRTRALAHEIDHYLLRSKTHTAQGLMRAVRSSRDFFSTAWIGFGLTVEQREVATRHLVHSISLEAGGDGVVYAAKRLGAHLDLREAQILLEVGG
jgi:hypothetical protein